MGKAVSKEQVVIAQSGSSVGEVDSHMSTQNMLLIAITAMLLIILFYYLWRQFKCRIKRWLRQQIVGNAGLPHNMVVNGISPPPASVQVQHPAPAMHAAAPAVQRSVV